MINKFKKHRMTLQERHLQRIKKHKPRAVRDGLIVLGICVCILGIYQLFQSGAGEAEMKVSNTSDEELTINAVGDVMTGRFVEIQTDLHGPSYPFEQVESLLHTGDIVTGNFEHPVLQGDYENYEEDRLDKSITLSTSPEAASAVKDAGFTHLNLANNHIPDYGNNGIFDTIETFEETGMAFSGAGVNIDTSREPHIEEANGKTVAVLGYNDIFVESGQRASSFQPGVTPMDPEFFIADIQEAAQEADFTIVHAHWGFPYDSSVHPRQREIGHAMAEAGADLIIGHHSHVLQPIEIYEDTVIAYSLGNFVFDQGWSMTRESAVLRYVLSGDKIELEIHPVYIEEGQPRPTESRYRQMKIFEQITEEFIWGSEFSDVWTNENGVLRRTLER